MNVLDWTQRSIEKETTSTTVRSSRCLPSTMQQYFMVEIFQMLNVSIQQLTNRLLDSNGMMCYKELETVLARGVVSDVISDYPELRSNLSLLQQNYISFSICIRCSLQLKVQVSALLLASRFFRACNLLCNQCFLQLKRSLDSF